MLLVYHGASALHVTECNRVFVLKRRRKSNPSKVRPGPESKTAAIHSRQPRLPLPLGRFEILHFRAFWKLD